MMRSMFAAISGLKIHQIVLDVTANDIANVNTVGYKVARTTFKDSLTQLQRGGAAPSGGPGGANAAQVGLGAQLGSIDNVDERRRPPDDRQRRSTSPSRARAGSASPPATRRGPGSTTDISTPARATSRATTHGYLVTQDGYYVIGRTARRPAAPTTYLNVPTGATNVAIGQDGSVTLRRRPAAARASTAGYLSLAKFANEARPRARLRQPLARDRRVGRRDRSARPARRLRPDHRRHASRCRTSTSPPSSRT